MLTNRLRLIFRLARRDGQEIPVGPQCLQLLRNARIHSVVQLSRYLVPGMIGVVEHRLVAVIITVNLDGFAQLIIRNVIALHRFDNRRPDEPVKFRFVRHRTAKRLKRLDHAGDDARVRFGQRTVKVKQHNAPR